MIRSLSLGKKTLTTVNYSAILSHMKTKTILESRIAARNLANAEANRLAPIFRANFAPLVGQKIMKVGGLMAKYEKLVPEITKHPNLLHMYRYPGMGYTLNYVVKACVEHEPCGCSYEEVSIYVGELRDGVLTKLMDWEDRPTDFTVEQITQARKACDEARKALHKAESGLFGFGEYDR